jgi:hypothetical protein
MWIFLNDGFFSIVESYEDKSKFLVRARIKGDLERVFGDHEVLETPYNDYRFRMILDKKYVTNIIANRIENIDYSNFKNSISPKLESLKSACSKVWRVMFETQFKLYTSGYWADLNMFCDKDNTTEEFEEHYLGVFESDENI